MTLSAALGYPRIGPKREVKKATEAYWAGKLSADELQKVAKEQRLLRWQTLQQQGVDVIPSCVAPIQSHAAICASRCSLCGVARAVVDVFPPD